MNSNVEAALSTSQYPVQMIYTEYAECTEGIQRVYRGYAEVIQRIYRGYAEAMQTVYRGHSVTSGNC